MSVAIAVCVGCVYAPYVPQDIEGPALPEAEYRQAADEGVPVYRIDQQRSRVYIYARREGPGHDHVIASEDVEGLVLLAADSNRARADLRIPLQKLVVDKPEYRQRFGLKPDLSESAINGTTGNMQDKVLESRSFPWAEVTARFASVEDSPPTLAVSITLHGASFEYLVPVEIESDDKQLSVTGSMTIDHSDFGLTAFSAAGGLLRVAEALEIEFELTAVSEPAR